MFSSTIRIIAVFELVLKDPVMSIFGELLLLNRLTAWFAFHRSSIRCVHALSVEVSFLFATQTYNINPYLIVLLKVLISFSCRLLLIKAIWKRHTAIYLLLIIVTSLHSCNITFGLSLIVCVKVLSLEFLHELLLILTFLDLAFRMLKRLLVKVNVLGCDIARLLFSPDAFEFLFQLDILSSDFLHLGQMVFWAKISLLKFLRFFKEIVNFRYLLHDVMVIEFLSVSIVLKRKLEVNVLQAALKLSFFALT